MPSDQIPVITEYAVKRRLNGQAKSLAFHCVNCHETLTAPIHDAGKNERCPVCNIDFRIPPHKEEPRPPKPPKRRPPARKSVSSRGREWAEKERRTPRLRASGEPEEYRSMSLAALIVRSIGIIGFIAAPLLLIGAIRMTSWAMVGVAISAIIHGFIWIVIAQCIEAFRDLVIAAKSINRTLGRHVGND